MIFYLGSHQTNWLSDPRFVEVPLFVSYRRLNRVQKHRQSLTKWCLDSGGFSELSLFGQWETSPQKYADDAQRWQDKIGNLQWAAVQDWMCEPFMIEKTRLSVCEHQKRTVASFHKLTRIAPNIPWIPILQGWHYEDYLRHVEQWLDSGVNLAGYSVGIGSVCRRQDTDMAEELIFDLWKTGLKLHAFGFKIKGLSRVGKYLESSDSMAWSLAARKNKPLKDCQHSNCSNCPVFALKWRERVLQVIDSARFRAPNLFEKAA